MGGVIEDAVEDDAVKVGEAAAATGHDTLGYRKEFLDRYVAEAAIGTSFEKARNEDTGKTGTMDIDTYPNHGGGIEHHVDSKFRMIADDGTAELEVGACEGMLAVVPKAYLRIVVLKVGAVDAGTDVAPLPYHSISKISVMRLIGISEDYGIVHFPAHLHVGAESGTAVKLGSHAGFGMVAESDRPPDAAAFHHGSVAADIYGTLLKIEHRSFHFSSLLDEYHRISFRVCKGAYHMIGIRQRLGMSVGCNPAEILHKYLGVHQENVVDESQMTKVFIEYIRELTCLEFIP